MSKKWLTIRVSRLLLGSVVVIFSCMTNAVPLTNSGFESDDFTHNYLPTGFANPTTPSGWQSTGSAGTVANRFGSSYAFLGGISAVYFGSYGGESFALTEKVGYVSNGTLYQTFTTIEAYTDYVITSEFGNRLDSPFGWPTSTADFFIGNLSNIVQSTSIAAPYAGYWNTQSFRISADLLTDYIGQTLGIGFTALTPVLTLDNVQYSAIDVPEPGVWLTFLAAMGWIVWPGRNGRRSVLAC